MLRLGCSVKRLRMYALRNPVVMLIVRRATNLKVSECVRRAAQQSVGLRPAAVYA